MAQDRAGRFRAPADDAVSALLEEGIGCKLLGRQDGRLAFLDL